MTLFEQLFAMLGIVRSELLGPLGLLVATIVTVHVLFHKRDIGAATAWIGLAWLSPFVGGMIYYVFGINRVRRRARRLVARRTSRPPRRGAAPRDWEGHLGALERAGSRITGRRMLNGNTLTVLENGDLAYPAMLEAIDGAERSIAMSVYLFHDDEAGHRFIEALGRAHRRGVAVRVLIDGIGSGYFRSGAARALRRQGVPTARFMHSLLPWRMPFLNLRTHKKILVVDGTRGFTGGMNVARENVLGLRPRHPVRDIHFDVSGPVVGQLIDAFARDWDFTVGEQLDPALWTVDIAEHGTAHARVATSGPDSDIEKIEFLVLQAIACARTRVTVMTPYFLPDDRIVTALGLAAMRGVAVDVVMPRRGNHRIIDWAARANSLPLLADGARIWLNDPPFEHSKIMVVDGLWCLIGSANWDMRSFRLNFELTMEVYDEALAARLEAIVETRKSTRLTREQLAARRFPVRLGDAATRLLLPYL